MTSSRNSTRNIRFAGRCLTACLILLGFSSWQSLFAKPAIEEGKAVVNKSKSPPPQGDRKKRLRAGYHFNTAEEHRRAKNFTSAVAEYKKAIADAPDEADFYKNLGGTYAQMGKLKEAEDALRKGTQIDPKDWLIWNNLAVTQQMSGKKEDCLKSLKKAMSLHPPDQEAEKMRFTIESLEGKKAPDGKKTGK